MLSRTGGGILMFNKCQIVGQEEQFLKYSFGSGFPQEDRLKILHGIVVEVALQCSSNCTSIISHGPSGAGRGTMWNIL